MHSHKPHATSQPSLFSFIQSSLVCTPSGSPLLILRVHQLPLECSSVSLKVGASLQAHGHGERSVMIDGAKTSGE